MCRAYTELKTKANLLFLRPLRTLCLIFSLRMFYFSYYHFDAIAVAGDAKTASPRESKRDGY